MSATDTILQLSSPFVTASATVVAGAIAFVAHDRARRLQRILDADPQLAERERIAEEIETKRRQLSELEAAAHHARGLQEQEARLRAELATLQQRHDELTTSNHHAVSTLERVKSELAGLETTRRSQQDSLSAMQREESGLAVRLADARSAITGLDARRHEVESQLQGMESALQTLRVDTHEAESTLAALQHETRVLQHRRDELAAANDSMRERQSVLRAETAALSERERQLATLNQSLVSGRKSIEALTAEKDSLVGEIAERRARATAAGDELERLQAEVEGARDRLTVLQVRLDQAQTDRSEASSGIRASGDSGITGSVSAEAYRTRLMGVWDPELAVHATADERVEEKTALKRVTDHLKDCGLVFHERVVHQFHPSLKVANEAPLLVLAGISGTGKSLLPQRYAKAMGINLLVLPVQPRWDGPQDLLGFFNHLEQKYVATPLSRALLQMHRYEEDLLPLRPKDSGFRSLSDQMLLVLLDEMNLARIEFYFSEFLSRLEIRRELSDRPTADDRERAAVTIECGPRPTDLPRLRLFADSNVLFVGTMNEDETTQSLSDKVVDRANIIRFGMPRHMKTGASSSAADFPQLPHANWLHWCNTPALDPATADRVQKFWDRMNATLSPLGRAFGHRLLKAVSAYVRQYPVYVPDRVNRALADQIEMRILPRLRGVALTDGQEAIERAAQIAAECDDNALCEAIGDAQNNLLARRDDRFHWTGVSRLDRLGS